MKVRDYIDERHYREYEWQTVQVPYTVEEVVTEKFLLRYLKKKSSKDKRVHRNSWVVVQQKLLRANLFTTTTQ